MLPPCNCSERFLAAHMNHRAVHPSAACGIRNEHIFLFYLCVCYDSKCESDPYAVTEPGIDSDEEEATLKGSWLFFCCSLR